MFKVKIVNTLDNSYFYKEFETPLKLDEEIFLARSMSSPYDFEWDWDVVTECELCSQLFWTKDAIPGGRTGKSLFCCDQCKEEVDEEIQLWDKHWRHDYL